MAKEKKKEGLAKELVEKLETGELTPKEIKEEMKKLGLKHATFREIAVGISSVRLDQYFSGQSCVELFREEFGEPTVYLIPKCNATVRGPWEWKQMLLRFVEDTKGYLREYFKRNQSESGISEDKRRFGWKIAQRREDRVDTAAFCTTLWHNLFWLK